MNKSKKNSFTRLHFVVIAAIATISVATLMYTLRPEQDLKVPAYIEIETLKAHLERSMKVMLFDLGCTDNMVCSGIFSVDSGPGKSNFIALRLTKYLKPVKYCEALHEENECMLSSPYIGYNKTQYESYEKQKYKLSALVDIKGRIISFDVDDQVFCFEKNQKLAKIYVDINGQNGPNRLGNDFFIFEADCEGNVLPFGNELSDEELIEECGHKNLGETCAERIIREKRSEYF